MKKVMQTQIVATGLAMFSMFFGAGNIVFPLALGRTAGNLNIYAALGLLVTAVGVPLLGLISMILFDGNYKKYLYRIGAFPGFLLMTVIVALLGPLVAMPRLITVSYASLAPYFPDLSLFSFSLISVVITFIFTVKETKILDLLGYVLSPLLLMSLAIIIVKGFWIAPAAPVVAHSALEMFRSGLVAGNQMMDLLAAMFFSSVVLTILKRTLVVKTPQDFHLLAKVSCKASLICAALLGVVYLGMSSVASFYSSLFPHVPREVLLGSIAQHMLGSAGSLIVSIAVGLACLTTVIALAAIVAEFIQKELFLGHLNYETSLALTLMLTVATSTLGFEGIAAMASPVLAFCYPALIVLAMCNMAYKLFDVRMVKIPFFLTIGITIIVTRFESVIPTIISWIP